MNRIRTEDLDAIQSPEVVDQIAWIDQLRDLKLQEMAAETLGEVRCPLCRGYLILRWSHRGPYYHCRCHPAAESPIRNDQARTC